MANLLTRLQEFNLESGRYGVISKRISFLYNLVMHYYIIIRTHTLSGFTLGNCDCVLRIRSVSRWSLAQELSFLCMRHETSSAAAAAAVAVQCWHSAGTVLLRVSFLLAPIAFMSCPPSPFPLLVSHSLPSSLSLALSTCVLLHYRAQQDAPFEAGSFGC